MTQEKRLGMTQEERLGMTQEERLGMTLLAVARDDLMGCSVERYTGWKYRLQYRSQFLIPYSRGIPMQRMFYVYILANRTRRLYIGVTRNLIRRLFEHRNGIKTKFAHRYNIHRLVYWETVNDPRAAISREKQLKGWRREKKIALIESMNPNWKDLSIEWK
jgi:putative endonuclease